MFRDTKKNELAFDKSFVGSMAYQKNNNQDIHKIIANHTNEPTETGIAVYRAVDGIHDFETGLKKKNANTLLRTHYGIGDRNNNNDFLKIINNVTNVNNKTTSNKNNLHQNLDFNELTTLESSGRVVIQYPEYPGPQRPNNTFEHNLPTILPTMNLNDDIDENETIFDEHPKGDILMDIIIDDKTKIDLNKLRNYLMITPGSTYSKDAANIATEKFTELFGGHDFSFFSEILDPASEQSDMINKNVEITMVYCYLKQQPIYITLKKNNDPNKSIHDFRLQTWFFCFHIDPNKPGAFQEYNFGIIRNGTSERHPAPNIETTVQYILGTIDNKIFAKKGAQIMSFADRMINKGQKKLYGRDSLSKNQTQNLKNNGSFKDFYEVLLSKFQNDIRDITPEEAKVVLISFKTIGDQMYLYDAILLSEISKSGEISELSEPFVVSGDTFLVDYITYTKSCSVLSPATIGNVRGKRKLRVYIKPRDPAAAEAAQKLLEEKRKESLLKNINKTKKKMESYIGYDEQKNRYNSYLKKVLHNANYILNMKEEIEGTGRRAHYKYNFNNRFIDEYNVVEILYKTLISLHKLQSLKINNLVIKRITKRLKDNTLENAISIINEDIELAQKINEDNETLLFIASENRRLRLEIKDNLNQEVFDTSTTEWTEILKRAHLNELYIQMDKDKNKYKPSYNYPNTKNGNFEKMKYHLQMQINKVNAENTQEGGGIDKNGPAKKGVNIEKQKKKRLLKVQDEQVKKRSELLQEKRDNVDINRDIESIIDIINEIDPNITSIDGILSLIENIDPVQRVQTGGETTMDVVGEQENPVEDPEEVAEEEQSPMDEIAKEEEEPMQEVAEKEEEEEPMQEVAEKEEEEEEPMQEVAEEEETPMDEVAEESQPVPPKEIYNKEGLLSRRNALEQEDNAEWNNLKDNKTILLIFEISDILNSTDDNDTIENILKGVETKLNNSTESQPMEEETETEEKIESQPQPKQIESQPMEEKIESQPMEEKIESQPMEEQIESQPKQIYTTEGKPINKENVENPADQVKNNLFDELMEVGGKLKKKKTSLKKKKPTKKQSKSKKTKRIQIKKRKQTKKKKLTKK